MKKNFFCFAAALLLLLSATGTAFASDAGQSQNNARTSEAGTPDSSVITGLSDVGSQLSSNSSLQLMFAALQLELAETTKSRVLDGMSQVSILQEQQKQTASLLNTARECRTEAQNAGTTTRMPDDMAAYMDTNNLSYDTTGEDLLMTYTEWDIAIQSLEFHIEQLSARVQQQMVFIQDLMGQYNSYLSGTNTQTNSQQTLTSLARGMSIYDNFEAGLSVTTLIVGLVLGCVLTLAVQKLRRKQVNT